MSAELDSTALPHLSAIDARILGSLVEKQATTPETYPLTLNALLLACNQKTSREPVMNLSQGQLGQALRDLENRGLARLQMGNRADRWEHRVDKALELVPAQLALLALMLLRGPQTPGELLSRSARLHAFDDVDQVQHQLERLIARGMAVQIPRAGGQREDRFCHSLGDPADMEAILQARAESGGSAEGGSSSRIEALEARIAALEERLARLEGSDE